MAKTLKCHQLRYHQHVLITPHLCDCDYQAGAGDSVEAASETPRTENSHPLRR